MHECHEVVKTQTEISGEVFLPLLMGIIVLSTILIVLLLRDLHGLSKTYLFLQNFCAALYVFFKFVMNALIDGKYSETLALDVSKTGASDGIYHRAGFRESLRLREITVFISSIFKYEFYAFTILHTLNYKALVCEPLQYQQYSDVKRVVGRIFFSLIMAFFFSLKDLVDLVLASQFSHPNVQLALKCLAVYDIVKHVLFKAVYFGILWNTTLQIKKVMVDLEKVRNVDYMEKILILISYVPLCTSLLLFVDEIITTVVSMLQTFNPKRCDFFFVNLEKNVSPLLTLVTHTVCAIIHCLAYVVLFPNIRKKVTSLFCSNTE